MSAFICSDDHIGAIVRYLFAHGPSQWGSGFYIGDTRYPFAETRWQDMYAMLATENSLSVNHRYQDTQPSCQVDTVEIVTPTKRSVFAYRDLSPVEVIKQCACYDYQACEHDGWPDSDARKLIDVVIKIACNNLPGYDAAPWGI